MWTYQFQNASNKANYQVKTYKIITKDIAYEHKAL